jgi:hypothetical protein
MKEERRPVWRVLHYWKEIAHRGLLPRREEIDPWLQGEGAANLLLIAVEKPIELSPFVVVGVNLAVALCPANTLAGVLLSNLPEVVSARLRSDDRGQSDASWRRHPASQRAAPAL